MPEVTHVDLQQVYPPGGVERSLEELRLARDDSSPYLQAIRQRDNWEGHDVWRAEVLATGKRESLLALSEADIS